MVLAGLSRTVPCLCQHQCDLALSPLVGMRGVVELCPRGWKSAGRRVSVLPWELLQGRWAVPQKGTIEDTNLSQTCILFSVQPIYIHHSCYFFPQLHECVLPLLPSIFPEQTLPFFTCLSGRCMASSRVGRDHSSPRKQLPRRCAPSRSPAQPSCPLPPGPTFPWTETAYTAWAV